MAAERGLSNTQVAERVQDGRVNRAPRTASRSLGAIVRANVLTRFNAILGTLLVVILIVGPIQDALFGVVLVANTAIGIAQEWRAKRTLDRLSLLAAPRVTVVREAERHEVAVDDVVADDVVALSQGGQIVADGAVLEADGLEVDESLLTGESVPEAKAVDDGVLSGSFVTAGGGLYLADRVGAESYANQVAAEARRFSLVRSELRRGTDQILGYVTWLILPTAILLVTGQLRTNSSLHDALRGSVAGVGAMVPEGLVLLTSIAFTASVLRLGRRQVLVQELAAVEGLARVDVVCTDKTGTLTEPDLEVAAVETLDGVDADEVAAALGALAAADPDPNASGRALRARFAAPGWTPRWRRAFSSARRWSGAGFGEHGDWVMGAPNVLLEGAGDGEARRRAAELVDRESRAGRRVLLVTRPNAVTGSDGGDGDGPPTGDGPPPGEPVGLVAIEERVRPTAPATLAYFASQGVTVKVMSGDDPRTVGAVAARVGIADAGEPHDARHLPEDPDELADLVEATTVFGRTGPDQKQAMIRALQARGHTVAMTGDGVNDVLALKEADLGVAMGSGAEVCRAVAPVVLLDSDFAGLPPVLDEGRRVIANVERVANLFVTKTVYATILAVIIGLVRVPFPFLPRHLTIVSSLTIGIPAFFLALAPNRRRARPGFVNRVLRFAVPAGVLAAGATLLAYAEARAADVAQIEARTTATIALFIVAMWVLAILARPLPIWRMSLQTAMAGLFVIALLVPWSRHFFALNMAPPVVTAIGCGIAVGAGLLLEVGWHWSGWMRPPDEPPT